MENCLLLQCSLGVSRALWGLHQWERGESCRGSSPPAPRPGGARSHSTTKRAPGSAQGPPAAPPASSSGRGAPSLSPRGSAASAPPPLRPPPGLRSPLPPRAVPGRVREAMAGWWRCAERLFALYFVSHVPITLLIDLQPLLPAAGLYPRSVSRARGSWGCVCVGGGALGAAGSGDLVLLGLGTCHWGCWAPVTRHWGLPSSGLAAACWKHGGAVTATWEQAGRQPRWSVKISALLGFE